MSIRYFIVLAVSCLSVACGQPQNNNSSSQESGSNTINTEVIPGIYSAIMPCDGCQSRRVLVTLRPDHTGSHTDIWITDGKPESTIQDCSWQWNENSKRIEIRNSTALQLDLELQSDSSLLMSTQNENKAIVFRKQRAILNKPNELEMMNEEEQKKKLLEQSKDAHIKATSVDENKGK